MLLLVEHEAIVRHSFAQLLRTQGHEVIEAANGAEALAVLNKLARRACHYRSGGTESKRPHLISLIRARWPKMPIVLVSGCLSQEAGNIILDIGVRTLLSRTRAIHCLAIK
jgi:DNA-binding NarL/FixJ family response regulator